MTRSRPDRIPPRVPGPRRPRTPGAGSGFRAPSRHPGARFGGAREPGRVAGIRRPGIRRPGTGPVRGSRARGGASSWWEWPSLRGFLSVVLVFHHFVTWTLSDGGPLWHAGHVPPATRWWWRPPLLVGAGACADDLPKCRGSDRTEREREKQINTRLVTDGSAKGRREVIHVGAVSTAFSNGRASRRRKNSFFSPPPPSLFFVFCWEKKQKKITGRTPLPAILPRLFSRQQKS